jgi:hypothetical protein
MGTKEGRVRPPTLSKQQKKQTPRVLAFITLSFDASTNHYPLRMMFGHVKNLDKGGDAVCLGIISSRGSQDSGGGGGLYG